MADPLVLTEEQAAIVSAPASSMAVIACPGSGKTATAVRRLVKLRADLETKKGRIALLSFSNVAVDTFRREYQELRGFPGHDSKVVIQTVDSFLSNYIIKPHCNRVMQCERAPFLCFGEEPFLNTFRVGSRKAGFGMADLKFQRRSGRTIIYKKVGRADPVELMGDELKLTVEKFLAFAATGGYTYDSGRVWARLLLEREPTIAAALARRFPQILVDEAQDIGSFEGEIVNLLMAAGSSVSLIGDVHQSIYGFNFATGTYLSEFSERVGISTFPLSQNRRSVAAIVSVADAIAGSRSKPHRANVPRLSGAYFWKYQSSNLDELVSRWRGHLTDNGYQPEDAAVLCRGTDLVALLTTGGSSIGVSVVKHLATAALERDRGTDIAAAFRHCAKAVTLLLDVPRDYYHEVTSSTSKEDASLVRRHIWSMLREVSTGIPESTLPARSVWLPRLKSNLADWLDVIEEVTSLRRTPTWRARVTAKELPDTDPLLKIDVDRTRLNGIRVGTVHSAKGEGIPAVLYLMKKKSLEGLLGGTAEEEGRIGYVAVTRARDLIVAAVPSSTSVASLDRLRELGFRDWLEG
ncbi:TPA: UvrD-helicase domain-containing protein [Stenotrophomonas maltophilia]